MLNSLRFASFTSALVLGCFSISVGLAPAFAQDSSAASQTAASDAKKDGGRLIAKVNGKTITEADLLLAEQEIGRDLGQLPPPTKRLALTEFLIESQLLADEAEKEKLGTGKDFEERLAYWRRRALRETYFEKKLRASISDAAAETFYKDQVKKIQPEEEVQARHILVEKEEDAQDLHEQISRGADFAELAGKHSKDPGSAKDGGMLGYFSKGQMVPVFEKTAFALQKGEVSEPVQSKFGWHIVKVENRRTKPVPTFEEVKDRIVNMLVYQRQQALTESLRKKASVEYHDLIVLQAVKARDEREKLKQQLIQETIKRNAEEKAKKEKAGEKQ